MKNRRLVIALTVLSAGLSAQAAYIIRIVDPPAVFGDNNQLDNINEAEGILASPPAGSTIFNDRTQPIINFNGAGGAAALTGFGGDDFAFSATGFVDVTSGNGISGTFNLYVNSDDGFRLRRNGAVISEFVGPTGASNTTATNILLTDGDRLDLTFFERAGGDFIVFKVNDNAGAFVGDPASGLLIAVPEPMMPAMLGFGALSFLARRRRR